MARHLLVLRGFGYLGLGLEDRHRKSELGSRIHARSEPASCLRPTKGAQANVGQDLCLCLRLRFT